MNIKIIGISLSIALCITGYAFGQIDCLPKTVALQDASAKITSANATVIRLTPRGQQKLAEGSHLDQLAIASMDVGNYAERN